MRLETRVMSGDRLLSCTETMTDREPFCHSGSRGVVTRHCGHEHSATPPSAICTSPWRLCRLSLSFFSSPPLVFSWMLFQPHPEQVLHALLLVSFLIVSEMYTFICAPNSDAFKKWPFLPLYFSGTTDAPYVTCVVQGWISCPSHVVLCLLVQYFLLCDIPPHTTQPTTN